MGYIKKAHREILKILDDTPSFPNGWDNFVDKQAVYHNLIIKSAKNKCFCTNCKSYFISKKKINQEVRCPNCHNTYLIRRSNLKYKAFKDYISILDKVNNIFVIRYFELKTVIDAMHEHHTSVAEFAREIPTDNYYRDVYVNERVSKCQQYIYIYHDNGYYINDKKWRQYTRGYSLIDYSIVFPNNIKKLLKDTEYKYSCIWDIAKHSTYIDLLRLLKEKEQMPIVEMLCKMKLYNLAQKTHEFKNFGSFQKIFGISKDYYDFMKKHNITYTQLKILRLLKEENIKKIRYLENYVFYGGNTTDLEEISQYISLNRFIRYSKMHHKGVKTYLYKDYLRFAKFLGLDLSNNKYAFPKHLKEAHDKLECEYYIKQNPKVQKIIIKRGKELYKNRYHNEKFLIVPALNIEALQDESKQQNNCVRTYAEKYANGNCDIYFMREVKQPKKSLVTIEVKNNRVVQSRIKNNAVPNKNQLAFINKWEQKVLKGVA